MYKVTRVIHFCYGHRLLNYDGKCRHLHGHNGRVEIELQAPELDARGFVVDFGDIKRAIKRWIDETLDHRMILCKDDPILPALRDMQEPLYVLDANPTAEAIARLIYDYAVEVGFPVTEVRLWETTESFAAYAGAATVDRP